MTYTAPQREAAIKWLREGHSAESIANVIGCAPSTVYAWHRKKFGRRSWTDAERRKVANRWKQGDSAAWLARRYAVSRTSIYRWAKLFL